MESGQRNHSWCMGVISHSCGGLCGAGMEVAVGKRAEQCQEWLKACREMMEHFTCAS